MIYIGHMTTMSDERAIPVLIVKMEKPTGLLSNSYTVQREYPVPDRY